MVTRREFLQVSVAASGGLLVACRSAPLAGAAAPAAGNAATAAAAPEAAAAPRGPASFGAYLEIAPDGGVTITCPQAEMGQGVHDGLAKVLAEELDADWSRVAVRLAPADDAYINPITKRHRTANSESTVVYYDLLRRAGATARGLLVAVAARRWGVAEGECTTGGSRVRHAASGRDIGYGELAAEAATLPVPPEPRLKSPGEFTLIGRSTPRKDAPAKIEGSAVFGIDVRLPGMLYAALHRSPAVTSKLLGFDRETTLRRPGVFAAFEIPDGVAVVAGSTWQAMQAAAAVEARFDTSAAAGVDSDVMRRSMLAALDDEAAAAPGRAFPGTPPYDRDATLAAIAAAPVKHEWTYEVPYLAHAALEPLCATAIVREDSCEMWAPTQQPDRARDALAQITGLPRARCRLNVTFLGGGFGRKWELDFIRQTAQVALGVRGRPVKLTWTREQDFRHDRYRPAHMVRTRVGLAGDGRILGMHSRTTGVSMWKYQGRALAAGMGDPFATGLLINDRYALASRYVDYVEAPVPIPVGTWRSVSLSMNGFFGESAIDDIAAVTGQDPLALRLGLLGRDERSAGVLRLAAQKAGWGRRLPHGQGMGIALSAGFDSFCAQVVEVAVSGRQLHVERIVCAFDCGQIVDPHNVEAQVSGGAIWGLSAALDGRIRFASGAARESNFHDAPILRIDRTPKIEVHLVHGAAKPGGAGEASVPPVAPALASAIHAATGHRPRRLPLTEAGFR